MLTLFRKMLRSKIGPLLFGIVIVGMAVWGIDDIFSGSGGSVVKAGDRGISLEEFNDVVQDRLVELSREEKRAVTLSEAVDTGLVDQIFQQQLQRLIVVGYGEQIGARASTKAVSEEVFANESFNNALTGKFDADVYKSALRRGGLTVREFEQDIRDFLTTSYIADAASASVEPPDVFTQLQSKYLGETRYVSILRIDGGDVDELPPPTDEQLLAYFEDNRDAFGEPERRGLTVLHFSPADFRQSVEITDEMMQQAYELGKLQQYSTPQTRRYLEAAFETEAAALQAFGILAAGGAPDTLENVLSSSTTTAKQEDIADTDYAETLFGPAEGAVVGPVNVGNQWVIARIEEIIPGDPYPFETVKDDIKDALVSERAQLAFEEAARSIEDIRGEGLNLKQIGERIGAPAISFVPVDARGITASNDFVISLPSTYPEVLKEASQIFEGDFTKRYDLEDGGLYIGQLETIVPPSTAEFENVRDRVLAQWQIANSSEAISLFAENLARKINRGETTLRDEARRLGKSVERLAQPITRRNSGDVLSSVAASAVFAAKKEGEVVAAPSTARREALLVFVDKIEMPDASTMEALRSPIRQILTNALDADLESALVSEIANTVEIDANERAFDAYKAQNASQ